MDLKAAYTALNTALKEYGIDTHELESRWIIEDMTPYAWSDIVSAPHSPISDSDFQSIMNIAQQRGQGIPLSRALGEREFWGLAFYLSEDTLDPRPDTELIIDLALKRFSKDEPLRILDLGTGTGCILLSLLSEFKNAQGVGVDLSSGAIETAEKNARRHDLHERVSFMQGSWFEPVSGKFDLIVSNPPYIASNVIPTLDENVQNHDPILALDGGINGMDAYNTIFSEIKNYMKPHGIALFEIGYDQEADLTRLIETSGFALRGVHIDLAGNPRVVEISCGDK